SSNHRRRAAPGDRPRPRRGRPPAPRSLPYRYGIGRVRPRLKAADALRPNEAEVPVTLFRDGRLPRDHPRAPVRQGAWRRFPAQDSGRSPEALAGQRMAGGRAEPDARVRAGSVRADRARADEGSPAQEGPGDPRPASTAPRQSRTRRPPPLTARPNILRFPAFHSG